MLSAAIAADLRDAGLMWTPSSGDRFVVTQPAMEGEVFTVAEMTVEVHRFVNSTVLGFNGTTEWALDSVTLEGALWLPREDQLRELLGKTFRSLEKRDRYVVCIARPGQHEEEFRAEQAADAYGAALLALVRQSTAA